MPERRCSSNIPPNEMQSTTTRGCPNPATNARLERLQAHLAERDEIIVALQHIIRDLRHEIENLRAEQRYLAGDLVPGGRQPGIRTCRAVPLEESRR